MFKSKKDDDEMNFIFGYCHGYREVEKKLIGLLQTWRQNFIIPSHAAHREALAFRKGFYKAIEVFKIDLEKDFKDTAIEPVLHDETNKIYFAENYKDRFCEYEKAFECEIEAKAQKVFELTEE
jgi:hypothetical protein